VRHPGLPGGPGNGEDMYHESPRRRGFIKKGYPGRQSSDGRVSPAPESPHSTNWIATRKTAPEAEETRPCRANPRTTRSLPMAATSSFGVGCGGSRTRQFRKAKRKKLVGDLSRARSALRRDAEASVEGRKEARGTRSRHSSSQSADLATTVSKYPGRGCRVRRTRPGWSRNTRRRSPPWSNRGGRLSICGTRRDLAASVITAFIYGGPEGRFDHLRDGPGRSVRGSF